MRNELGATLVAFFAFALAIDASFALFSRQRSNSEPFSVSRRVPRQAV